MNRTCKHCGREFQVSKDHKKYCPECGELTYYARTAGLKKPKKQLPKIHNPDGTVNCSLNNDVRRKCFYSCNIADTAMCCDYLIKTGKMRGCPADRCDKYKEGKKKKEWSNYHL